MSQPQFHNQVPMGRQTEITNPYKRDNPLIVIASLVILVPLGLAGIVASFFLMVLFLPLGLITLVISFLIMAGGFSALVKVSRAECPHCGNVVRVAKKTTIFKCRTCKRKVSKINNTLNAI